MKKFFMIMLVAALAVTAVFASGSSEESATVSTDGSTSMEQVILSLAEQYMTDNPGVNVTYNPTGSGTGITAALEGRCDIGLSSRALKDDEIASGLTETIIALDGIYLYLPVGTKGNAGKRSAIVKGLRCLVLTIENDQQMAQTGRTARIIIVETEHGRCACPLIITDQAVGIMEIKNPFRIVKHLCRSLLMETRQTGRHNIRHVQRGGQELPKRFR